MKTTLKMILAAAATASPLAAPAAAKTAKMSLTAPRPFQGEPTSSSEWGAGFLQDCRGVPAVHRRQLISARLH